MIGYKIVHEEDIYWKINLNVMMPLVPFKVNSTINNEIAKKLLKKFNCSLIRWEVFASGNSETAWWHVVKKNDGKSLSSKVRNQVKKGKQNYYCEVASREYIANNAYIVYQQSHTRYDTFERLLSFDQYYQAILEMPDCTEFFVVRDVHSDELVGFSENYLQDSACFFNSMWFIPAALNKYCAYALISDMIDYYFVAKNFIHLTNGARNINHKTNMHEFLINKFGFEKLYCNLHVQYANWLNVLIKFFYPFRSLIPPVETTLIKKARVLLIQEKIARSFK